jgi:hypothetical protein
MASRHWPFGSRDDGVGSGRLLLNNPTTTITGVTMNKLTRIFLAGVVLATVTAVPASAAPLTPAVETASFGICKRWPKLCGLHSIQLAAEPGR